MYLGGVATQLCSSRKLFVADLASRTFLVRFAHFLHVLGLARCVPLDQKNLFKSSEREILPGVSSQLLRGDFVTGLLLGGVMVSFIKVRI